MFLKNYTSNVPASETIANIQHVLLRAGVKTIEMDYGPNHEVVAITFKVQADAKFPPLPIRIPAKVREAQDALWMEYVGTDRLATDGNSTAYPSQKRKTRKDFLEQGKRTAWKLMQDWIEVQLSLIQLNQVDVMQVFLSYVWDGKQTFYDRLKGTDFKALMPPKEEPEWKVVS